VPGGRVPRTGALAVPFLSLDVRVRGVGLDIPGRRRRTLLRIGHQPTDAPGFVARVDRARRLVHQRPRRVEPGDGLGHLEADMVSGEARA